MDKKTQLQSLLQNNLQPNQVTNTKGFLHWLHGHKMGAYYFFQTKQMDFSSNPTLKKKLENRFQRNKLRALRQLYILQQVQELFDKNQIPFLVIKGLPLSQLLYKNIAVRTSKDIDILIAKKHARQAHALLLSMNFKANVRRGDYSMEALEKMQHQLKDLSYYHEEKNVILELHWRLGPDPYYYTPSFKQLWDTRNTILLGGFKVNTLNPDERILYLCMHASTHIWFRAQWLNDIIQLMSIFSFNWSHLLEKSKAYNIKRSFVTGIVLACEFAKIPIPHIIQLEYTIFSAMLKTIARKVLLKNFKSMHAAFFWVYLLFLESGHSHKVFSLQYLTKGFFRTLTKKGNTS